MKKTCRQIGLISALSICLLPLAVFAQEPNAVNPGVMAPDSRPFGQSYAMWGVNFSKWSSSLPRDRNPMNEPTGKFMAEGQSGPVWFLACLVETSAKTVVLPCSIPAGKAVLVPIAGTFWNVMPYDHPEDWGPDGWQPGMPHLEQDLAYFLKNEYDGIYGMGFRPALSYDFATIFTQMSCEIDGKAVENLAQYRTPSPAYNVVLPEDNMWDDWYGGLNVPAGEYGPVFGDGINLILEPPSVGEHTIHVRVEFSDGGIADLTYLLTITPEAKVPAVPSPVAPVLSAPAASTSRSSRTGL